MDLFEFCMCYFTEFKFVIMNWYVIIIIGVLAIALIVFLVIRNQKDEEDLEKTIEDDYVNPKHEHIDTEIDRKT